MATALIYASDEPNAPSLGNDLLSVGFDVVSMEDCAALMQQVVQIAPDIIIVHEARPDNALFDAIRTVGQLAARPVVVFTSDPDADRIDQATRSGVHAYVVNGYGRGRLRSIVHLAQSRFRNEQLVRDELSDVSRRFEERKLVDRAKGILMGARQLREEEAYTSLRSTAMRTKQRIGQVSAQVIDGARYAEAINRAGQLRMLSQRLVKLYALACTPTRPEETASLFQASAALVDTNLAVLARSLSKPTFGDLLDGVTRPWTELRRVLVLPASVAQLPPIDRLAGELLARAEVLTENLEITGLAAALHVINVAGRQRMLSQQLAKDALLAALLAGPASAKARAAMRITAEQIEVSLDYLAQLPMSNATIGRELEAAREEWVRLGAAAAELGSPDGRDGLAVASEALLATLERLTAQLERGIQALVA